MLTPSFAGKNQQLVQPVLVEGIPMMAFPEGYQFYEARNTIVKGIMDETKC